MMKITNAETIENNLLFIVSKIVPFKFVEKCLTKLMGSLHIYDLNSFDLYEFMRIKHSKKYNDFKKLSKMIDEIINKSEYKEDFQNLTLSRYLNIQDIVYIRLDVIKMFFNKN